MRRIVANIEGCEIPEMREMSRVEKKLWAELDEGYDPEFILLCFVQEHKDAKQRREAFNWFCDVVEDEKEGGRRK